MGGGMEAARGFARQRGAPALIRIKSVDRPRRLRPIAALTPPHSGGIAPRRAWRERKRMDRRSIITQVAGLAATGLVAASNVRADTATIRGSAAYRERMALPPGAVLAVALLDISRADAPAETLAEARIPIEGQVPVGFALPYDPARIQPSHRYAIRGAIEVEGRTAFRTDTITRC
jgi:uncharacterized lipoprotein YbaY